MADQQDRPEPDHTEDPRGKQVGEGGYAEEQPGDAGGGGSGDRAGHSGDDEATERAPGTSSPSEGEATGNPGAAGA